MNFVHIVKQKTDAALREILLEWMYCIPGGWSLTKSEKQVTAALLFFYLGGIKEVKTGNKPLSEGAKALIWENVFSTSTFKVICELLKMTDTLLRVHKAMLKRKGVIDCINGCCKVSEQYIPKFDKNGNIVIKTVLSIGE